MLSLCVIDGHSESYQHLDFFQRHQSRGQAKVMAKDGKLKAKSRAPQAYPKSRQSIS